VRTAIWTGDVATEMAFLSTSAGTSTSGTDELIIETTTAEDKPDNGGRDIL
jgi:hypothetical protein